MGWASLMEHLPMLDTNTGYPAESFDSLRLNRAAIDAQFLHQLVQGGTADPQFGSGRCNLAPVSAKHLLNEVPLHRLPRLLQVNPGDIDGALLAMPWRRVPGQPP